MSSLPLCGRVASSLGMAFLRGSRFKVQGVHACAHVHVCICACVHIHACMYECVCACMCVSVCVRVCGICVYYLENPYIFDIFDHKHILNFGTTDHMFCYYVGKFPLYMPSASTSQVCSIRLQILVSMVTRKKHFNPSVLVIDLQYALVLSRL